MASDASAVAKRADSNLGVPGVSIYRAGHGLLRGRFYLPIIPLYAVMQGLRILRDLRSDTGAARTEDLIVLAVWVIATLVVFAMLIYLRLRTQLRFSNAGITLTDQWKPKLLIAWENIRSLDVYDGYLIGGSRVLVYVKDIEGCFDGLTDRQKVGASKEFIYGPDLICFSTTVLGVSSDQIIDEVNRRSALPTTQNEKVDSITTLKEFEHEPFSVRIPTNNLRRVWCRSLLENLGTVAISLAFIALNIWACATERRPAPVFNVGMGILIMGGIITLAWYAIDAPWVAIDSQALSFKGFGSKKVVIPFKFIDSTRTRISLGGLLRTIEIVLSDLDGYLSTLPVDERKFDNCVVKGENVVRLSLYGQRVLPQELQPELRRRINEWQASRRGQEHA